MLFKKQSAKDGPWIKMIKVKKTGILKLTSATEAKKRSRGKYPLTNWILHAKQIIQCQQFSKYIEEDYY